MSVALTYESKVTIVETLETNVPAASSTNARVTHDQYNSSQSLTSATTPPVTKSAAFSKAMSGGAGTIDFTALTGTNGATVDGTGLKVQVAKFKNPTSNANAITITEGASNGLAIMGSSFSVTLQPGQEITFYGNDASPDIASGDRTIDLAGTLAQTLQCTIVMG